MNQPWVHVIGGGIAGLSLSRELAQYPDLPGPVVISDPRSQYTNDRTFAFWFLASERDQLKPYFSVDRWSISTTDQQLTQQSQRYRYGIRDAGSVYDEALQAIDAHPQMTRRIETVQSPPRATHCYDSRPPSITDFKIIQAFAGTEIRCAEPHNLTTVGLMDALTCVNHRVRFRYLIPIDAHRLLVEHTEFTAEPSDLDALEALNLQWINESYPSAQVTRTEKASIPMGYRQALSHFGTPIGARGGMTRPATGYGYRTIQYWAKAEAARLVQSNQSRVFKPSTVHHWMDHLFLDLIRDRPDVVPQIFIAMGRRLSGDQFAQFMMREGLIDALRVVFASPKKPFSFALIGKPQWI